MESVFSDKPEVLIDILHQVKGAIENLKSASKLLGRVVISPAYQFKLFPIFPIFRLGNVKASFTFFSLLRLAVIAVIAFAF